MVSQSRSTVFHPSFYLTYQVTILSASPADNFLKFQLLWQLAFCKFVHLSCMAQGLCNLSVFSKEGNRRGMNAVLQTQTLKTHILEFAFSDPVKAGIAKPGKASAYKIAICRNFGGYILKPSTSQYCKEIVEHKRRQDVQDLQVDAIGFHTIGSDMAGHGSVYMGRGSQSAPSSSSGYR